MLKQQKMISKQKMSQSASMNIIVRDFFGPMMMFQGRNAQRQNLLHYACTRNEYQLIVSLITKGCRLCQQDLMGCTPLHVAIDMGHTKCVQVFRNLLHNYYALQENIQRDLRQLFKIYNHLGHTVLHEAALKNMQDTVRDMLNFCKEHHIYVADNEVLGCGDSLLHLMVRENLLEMAAIVCECVPDLVKCRNYRGQLPQDLDCLTAEMAGILKNAIKTTKKASES